MSNYQPGNTSFSQGALKRSYASNLSRTATSAAELFTLPPYSIISSISVKGPVSNAGTSARISLGSNGGATNGLLSAFNVKANGTVSYPSSFAYDWAANDPNPVVVTGIYAEDGNASNTGGPWLIEVETLT